MLMIRSFIKYFRELEVSKRQFFAKLITYFLIIALGFLSISAVNFSPKANPNNNPGKGNNGGKGKTIYITSLIHILSS